MFWYHEGFDEDTTVENGTKFKIVTPLLIYGNSNYFNVQWEYENSCLIVSQPRDPMSDTNFKYEKSVLWQQLTEREPHPLQSPHGKHANIRLLLLLRCVICSGDNSAPRTPASVLPIPVAANGTLANVDRSVCFCGSSTHQKLHNFGGHRPLN